jgi:FlgD Ig-like domain
MTRPAVPAFAALVVATVAAFFVTQHLKVTTPLLAGYPAPYPATINPVGGVTCDGVNHRRMSISFYLLHRSDDVDVYVRDQSGAIVATLATGRHMRRGVRKPDGVFLWNGREDDGKVAPDGDYFIDVDLIHQGRMVEISNSAGQPLPVTVDTTIPHPVITSIVPSLLTGPVAAVRIHYTGTQSRGVTVRIYRTDPPGAPRLVKSFFSPPTPSRVAVWDGRIDKRPAPAGTYLVSISATDAACNTGRYPARIPPSPGAAPNAGLSVRYLAAQPPLDPVAAGSRATVRVETAGSYQWTLTRAGAPAPVGSGNATGSSLSVPLPSGVAGLYKLSLSAGTHGTAVPLVASGARAKLLVVLPALSWQGSNPVDDNGDGLPDTLAADQSIELQRPLVNGLPRGFGDESALLAELDKAKLRYDLTTDLGLLDGVGPALAGHAGVVLAGTEEWIPASLAAALRQYVSRGGHLLSFGIDSLRRLVTVTGARALDPTAPAPLDALGARVGAVRASSPAASMTVTRDDLGLFTGAAAKLKGYRAYEPIAPSRAGTELESSAGLARGVAAIVGYRLGNGLVIDVGLPGFGSSLASNAGARALVRRLWSVLGG